MTRRQVIAATLTMLAYIASQANLARILGPLSPSIFSLQLSFSAHDFWRVVELWGAQGVGRYRSHFVYDFIHPFIYGTLGYVWARQTPMFDQLPGVANAFFVGSLPVAGLCDLVENTIHFHLFSQASGYGGSLVLVSGTASAIKWSLAAIFLAVLLGRVIQMSWPKRSRAQQPIAEAAE